MNIIQNETSALEHILLVEPVVFESNEVPELVENLLHDASAQPQLSLLAYEQTRPVGHVLFTPTHLKTATRRIYSTLLAPLAVIPDFKNKGSAPS